MPLPRITTWTERRDGPCDCVKPCGERSTKHTYPEEMVALVTGYDEPTETDPYCYLHLYLIPKVDTPYRLRVRTTDPRLGEPFNAVGEVYDVPVQRALPPAQAPNDVKAALQALLDKL